MGFVRRSRPVRRKGAVRDARLFSDSYVSQERNKALGRGCVTRSRTDLHFIHPIDNVRANIESTVSARLR